MNEKSRRYYEYLKSKNVNVPSDFESFDATMQDDQKRQSYYEYLKGQDGVNVAPDFESFTLTLKKKDETVSEDLSNPQEQPTEPSVESGQENTREAIPPSNEKSKQKENQKQQVINPSDFGADNMLSKEMKGQKREEEIALYSKLFEGKTLTDKEELELISKREKELSKKLDELPVMTQIRGGQDYMPSEEELKKQIERNNVIQERLEARKELKKKKLDNEDIVSYLEGARYEIDGKKVLRSEMYSYMTSNEFTDALKDGKDHKKILTISDDKGLNELLEYQVEASEMGWFEETGRGFINTTESFLDAARVKAAELSTIGLSAENAARVVNWTGGGQLNAMISNKALENAKEEVKESGGNLNDAFLRQYAKGLADKRKVVSGMQMVKTEDAIDRFANGDFSGGVKDVVQMSAVSAPYTIAAMTGAAGIVAIANTVQTNTYYEDRNKGVSKKKAALHSGASAVVNTLDAIVTRTVFKGAQGAANNATKKISSNLGYSKEQIKELRGAVARGFYSEFPTEFGQGTSDAIMQQWVDGEYIDFPKAIRQGTLEAMASVPSSAVSTSPASAKLIYAPFKKRNDFNNAEKAVSEILIKMSGTENQKDLESLTSQATMLVEDYVTIEEETAKTQENATEEESKILSNLTFKELSAEKAIEESELSEDTKSTLKDKLSEVRIEKAKVLKEINDRVEEGELSQSSDQASDQANDGAGIKTEIEVETEAENETKTEELSKEEEKTSQDQTGVETAQEKEASAENAPAEELEETPQEKRKRIEEKGKGTVAAIKDIVKKVKSRNVGESTNPKKIAEAVIPYLESNKFVSELDTNDREAVFRGVLSQFSIDTKKAPSVNKVYEMVFGKEFVADKKAAFTTTELIRGDAKLVRAAKKSLDQARKDIASKLNEMSGKGLVTAKKVASIINKLSSVNLESKRQVDALVDFVNRELVRAEARNEKKEDSARKGLRKRAISKLKSIKANKSLKQPLMRALGYNTNELSEEAKKLYDKAIGSFNSIGKKDSKTTKATLTKELNALNKQVALDIASLNEVFKKMGELFNPKLTFEENLDNIEDSGVFTKDEISLAEKNKSLFEDLFLAEDTKEESDKLEEEFKDSVEALPSTLEESTAKEREALRIAKTLKLEDYNKLSKTNQRKLRFGLNALVNGIVTGEVLRTLDTVSANRGVESIPLSEIKDAGAIGTLTSKLVNATKNAGRNRGKKKSYQLEKIMSAPLANMEQLFKTAAKKFESTNIFQTLFRPSATAYSKLESVIKDIKKKITTADSLLSKDQNKRIVQKLILSLKGIQLEYESNFIDGEKNPETNTAIDWFNATMSDENSRYDEKTKKIFKEAVEKYIVDGQISIDKINESLTAKEKAAEKIIREVYDEIQEMAEHDAAYQGLPFVSRENYVHLPKSVGETTEISEDLSELANSFSNEPSVKSKVAIARQGTTHATSFDPIINAYSAATKTATSYYMQPEISKAKQSFSALEKKAKTTFEKELVKALKGAYVKTINNLYDKSRQNGIEFENIMKGVSKAGYRVQLAGVVRASWELASNAIHSYLSNGRKVMSAGFKITNNHDSATIDKAIKSIPTTQMERISSDGGISSAKDVEGNLVTQAEMYNPEISTSEANSKMKSIGRSLSSWKISPRKLLDFNDWLISRPDQVIAKNLLLGKLSTSFKEITGKDLDINKLANDKSYYESNKEAIDKATEIADTAVLTSVASNNPFEGIPKNMTDKQANGILKMMQFMDRYMTRFRVFEYYSSVKAIQSLAGKGEITRAEGARLLAGTVVRMAAYKAGMDVSMSMIYSLLGIGDEDDEKKGLGKKAKEEALSATVSALVTLAIGRNLGNFALIAPNYFIEAANKEYGEGILRDGEYNKFEDGLVFDKVPDMDNPSQNVVWDFAKSMSGSFSPLLKTTERSWLVWNEVQNRRNKPINVSESGSISSATQIAGKQETLNRYERELYMRIPFEIAGATGVIPSYKTFRKIMLQEMYGNHKGNKNRKK